MNGVLAVLPSFINDVHQEGLANITALAEGKGDALQRLRNVIVGHVEHELQNLKKTAVFLHELQALSPDRQSQIVGGEHA